MKYYFKNKDVVLAILSYDNEKFIIDKLLYDISSFVVLHFLSNDEKLNLWLRERQSSFGRVNMFDLFKLSYINSVLDFVLKTKCLSLNDTFWICSEDDNLIWNDVSLFKNDFDATATNIAWGTYSLDLIVRGFSPEFSTKGVSMKCWQRIDSNIYLLKSKGGLAELEYSNVYSEYFASQLAEFLGFNHATYTLRKKSGVLASCSKLFTSELVGFVSMSELFGGSNCGDIYSDIKCLSSLPNSSKILYDYRCMLLLDSLTHNSDRHNENYGLLFNTDTFEIIGLAPIFDNDNSLFNSISLCNKSRDQIKEKVNIIYPKTYSGTFIQQGKHCLTKDLYERVKLVSTDFNFKNSSEFPLIQKRVDILSSLVRMSAKSIIK